MEQHEALKWDMTNLVFTCAVLCMFNNDKKANWGWLNEWCKDSCGLLHRFNNQVLNRLYCPCLLLFFSSLTMFSASCGLVISASWFLSLCPADHTNGRVFQRTIFYSFGVSCHKLVKISFWPKCWSNDHVPKPEQSYFNSIYCKVLREWVLVSLLVLWSFWRNHLQT